MREREAAAASVASHHVLVEESRLTEPSSLSRINQEANEVTKDMTSKAWENYTESRKASFTHRKGSSDVFSRFSS
jgi:hypothetical protein